MNKIASHAVVALLVLMGTVVVMRSQQLGTQRIPQFENEDVKVWNSVVYPDSPLRCTGTTIPALSSRSRVAQ
jgi:hypothetical protein